VTLAWVLWWIDVVLSVCSAVIMPFMMFTRHQHSIESISALWMIPVVPCIVAAGSGGTVAAVLQPSQALFTVLVSYMLLGVGLSLYVMIAALYFAKLAIYKLPPREMIVSCFVPCGPCGQGSFAILQLAAVLYNLHESTGRSLIPTFSNTPRGAFFASGLYGCSIIVASFVWGLGMFWLIIALLSILEMIMKDTIPFNMGWWGIIFPIGTMSSGVTLLASELNSGSLRVIATIFTASVTLVWMFVMSRTAYLAWEGTMFVSPCLAPLGGEPPRKKTLTPSRPPSPCLTAQGRVINGIPLEDQQRASSDR